MEIQNLQFLNMMKFHDIDIYDQKIRNSWIRLARTEGVGSQTFFRLMNIFKDPIKALEKIPEIYSKHSKNFSIPTKSQIEDEMYQVEKFGAQIILACDKNFPRDLINSSSPPPLITVKGKLDLLMRNKISIVGSRNASINGCVFANKISYELGKMGFVIVSGLADGIDKSAHNGALEYGTIGISAAGINVHYPKQCSDLYKKMYETGLIISEYPFDSQPLARHFPERNRIIAVLSHGLLVVEASMKSGTLITSRIALEEGREVFAVPGFPFDARSSGTNYLLKNGAILVETAEDISYEMRRLKIQDHTLLSINKNTNEIYETTKSDIDISNEEIDNYIKNVLDKLSYSKAISIDLIAKHSEIPYNILSLILLELEIAQKIEVKNDKVILLHNSK